MRTVLALIVKFVLTFAAAVLASYIAGVVNWSLISMLALVGTIANYLIGDLLILPAAGNIVASLADGGMAGIIAYIMALRERAFTGNIAWFVVMFGVIVAIAEYFFHKYLKKDEKVAPS